MQKQTVEAVSLGVSVKVVTGEPAHVVNSLPGAAGGSDCFQGAVGWQRGIAVDR